LRVEIRFPLDESGRRSHGTFVTPVLTRRTRASA
jgi:hypothetical protein